MTMLFLSKQQLTTSLYNCLHPCEQSWQKIPRAPSPNTLRVSKEKEAQVPIQGGGGGGGPDPLENHKLYEFL